MAHLKHSIKHVEDKKKHDTLKEKLNQQHRRMSTVQNQYVLKGRLIIKCLIVIKTFFDSQ